MKTEISDMEFNVLEKIVHGVMVTDLKGHIIYSNPENVRIFGYSKSEVQGLSIHTLYNEKEKTPFKKILDKIEKEAPLHLEWHGIRKDNTKVWLDVRANIINSDNGEPDGCVISLHVIEDLKRAEMKSEKNKAFAEAILDSSVDAILSFDKNGKIVRLNDSASRLFGYGKQELIGRSVEMLIAPSHHDYTNNYLKKKQAGLEKRRMEEGMQVEALKKDGTEFPIELTIAEVTWDGKKIYTAVIKDMTGRRELERQIIEIGNEERRRIGRELHDGLGQMLTAIRLLSETAANKLKARNDAGADEVQEIAEMVREADDFARELSHGMVVTELEKKGFVQAVENLCERTQKATGINCTHSVKGEVEIRDSDIALHLYRIIQEAVNNSVKHSDAENIHVRLKNNPHLSIIIEDDGTKFDVEAKDEMMTGSGIPIMNYRTNVLGGHFELSRTSDNKTCVKCEFPGLKDKM